MPRPFVTIPDEGLAVPGRSGARIYPGAPTLTDLVREDQRLEVACGFCTRRALIPPVIAAWLLGPTMPVVYAAIRFRCSVCNQSADSHWITSRACIDDWHASRHQTWLADGTIHSSAD